MRSDRKRTAFAFARRADSGNMHALEAVLVAAIMLSAVAYVTTFDVPPPITTAQRDGLQRSADDALKILYDTPMDSNFGSNAMSVYILQCMQGTCTNLTTRLNNLLPDGVAYAVYVSNGYRTYPVYVMREPTGETVTATQLFEPSWSNTFVSPAADLVDPAKDPLLVYSLPIFNSNPLSPGGSPLQILVHGVRSSDHSEYTLTAAATTLAASATSAPTSAVSLYYVSANGTPIATYDAFDQTYDEDGDLTLAPIGLTLRLNESSGVDLDAGTKLTIDFPRGWNGSANATVNGAHWSITENASSRNGSYEGSQIVAFLLDSLSNGTVDFRFNATYHGDVLDQYPFHARLGIGAHSVAEVLVRADDSADTAFSVPAVHASVPRPMGASNETTWALAVFAPSSDEGLANLTENVIEVREIEIIEKNGESIFGAVQGIESAGGEWTVLTDRIVWTGSYRLGTYRPMNLTFNVVGSGVASAPGEKNPFNAPVQFDGFEGRLVHQWGPGFFRDSILPGDDTYSGYNQDVGSLVEQHRVRADTIYRGTSILGSANYSSGAASTMTDSLYGSYVSVERRDVPIGSPVVFTSNVQSILFALAKAGQEAGVTLRIYPPWGGDERVPIYESENLDQGLLNGDIKEVLALDIDDDGYADPIVGTDNGRVFAFNALTGDRLAGDVWTAPLTTSAQGVEVAASITALEALHVGGTKYIVVGTDWRAGGVYVLDTAFRLKWSFGYTGDTISIDASTDVTGDGQPDIVAGVENSNNGVVYVLEAPSAGTELVPYAPVVAEIPDAFYVSTGTPSALIGIPSAGPNGSLAGVAVTVQTLVDGGAKVYFDPANPLAVSQEQIPLSTPRAGLQAVDAEGHPTSTLFGSPITLAQRYDYDADGVTDVLAGGAAGYVFMVNGTTLTQPLYSLVVADYGMVLDADTKNAALSYTLIQDGNIYYTDDAWGTSYCATCELPLPTARGISSNATNSLWAVGGNNGLWRSEDHPLATVLDSPSTLSSIWMVPVTLSATRAGESYLFDSMLHDFSDVHFNDGERGDEGWVIGAPCSGAGCGESLIMRTVDGGQQWTMATWDDGSLVGYDGAPVTQRLNKIKFFGESGWVVGDGGTLLGTLDGSNWVGVETGVEAPLRDVACALDDPTFCMAVGDAGTALIIRNATTAPETERIVLSITPDVEAPTLSAGARSLSIEQTTVERDLLSVGLVTRERGYIGSNNMVLATFDGAQSWTTLPLNYIENDANVISVGADGTGFIYGGSAANARFWFLHDYVPTSRAQTVPLTTSLSATANITSVSLASSNATIGSSQVEVFASTNGTDWKSMGILTPPSIDPLNPLVIPDARNALLSDVAFTASKSGRDLRIRIDVTTSGDRTLESPFLRGMSFTVGTDEGMVVVPLDFNTTSQFDAANSTAYWDTGMGAVHHPYVREFWTRNVSGEVVAIASGHNVTGGAHNDVWVGTGDVLAINSPDYIIYAGSDENKYMTPDNRVYLLDGETGTIVNMTPSFDREVRHVRVGTDTAGAASAIFVTTTSDSLGSYLYALHPQSLQQLWAIDLGEAVAEDLEVSAVTNAYATAVAATSSLDPAVVGEIWVRNGTTGSHVWRTVPEEMGKYYISKTIPQNWLFGAYVAEIAVEWNDVVTKGEVSQEILRSARFYDYFVVTPHDALAPPAPLYNAHLVTWFPDWG